MLVGGGELAFPGGFSVGMKASSLSIQEGPWTLYKQAEQYPRVTYERGRAPASDSGLPE